MHNFWGKRKLNKNKPINLVNICIFYGVIQLSFIAYDYFKGKRDWCNSFRMTLVYVYKASNSKVWKTNESTSKLDVWVSFASRETFIQNVCLEGTTACTFPTASFKLSRPKKRTEIWKWENAFQVTWRLREHTRRVLRKRGIFLEKSTLFYCFLTLEKIKWAE